MADVPGSTASDVTLQTGVRFTGQMETGNDADFYRVTLEAGTVYFGLMSRFDEPIREFRLELYDPEGVLLLSRPWHDSMVFPYVSAGMRIQVAQTGTYYIAAISTDENGGWSHNLSVNPTPEFFGSIDFFGTTGNDTLSGSGYDEKLYGRTGDDTIFGRSGADSLLGDAGNDLLNAGRGRDRLLGEDGRDTLLGGDQDDRLSGGTGDDSLRGDAGNDRIDGGAGNDILAGGAGRDRFIFTPSGQAEGVWTDRITDFTRGTDLIDLSGYDDLAFAGRTAKADAVWYARSGKGVTVSIDSTGDAVADQIIHLSGVTRLGLSDFDLV